ncbi:hypothetical protein [Gimesia aquarii]|uniref:Uncharacterized protein n=1 Tax=Gimesia aquarii TaxID=2527964 RepID=A0A517WWK1_9PLAN|nr:hypothetical protein [Gimesia aquarii]QDU09589.1 hypothetical protein V202x_29640 [Gimesia aquarii]
MRTVTRKMALSGLCLIILLSSAGHSMLQAAGPFFPRRTIYNYGGYYSPSVFYGNRWYGGGYYGGYYGRGYYGGWNDGSSLVRAQGQALVDRSKAMVNYEDARSKYIDNQKKVAETYVARQKAQREAIQLQSQINEERAKQRQAALDRQAEKNRKMRESGLSPYLNASASQDKATLTASQFNPATGKINWPESLMGEEYKASREKIQELFSLRNSTGVTSTLSQQISDEAQVMKNILRGQIRNMLPNDYLSARGFIEGLANMGKTTA